MPLKKAKGDFAHLRLLAQEKSAPALRTTLDIKRLLVPASVKQYEVHERSMGQVSVSHIYVKTFLRTSIRRKGVRLRVLPKEDLS